MKFNKYIIFATLFVGLQLSCQKELTNINKNPNSAENPQPDYLLTSVVKSAADNYWGSVANFSSSQLITQQWARIQYTDVDRYVFANTTFSSFWSTIFSNNIRDLDQIIKLGTQQGNNNYIGVAHVLRVLDFQLLTDAFGDIPFSQADSLEKYPTPKYDAQQDVYHGLINELDTALVRLNTSGTAITGDPIYKGNISLWKKFANDLKLRIALRISDREPAISKTIIAEVLADPAGLISGNGEISQVTYDDSPNWNPVANIFSTRQDSRISKTVVDRLYALNDPRLPVYADFPDSVKNKYVGVPNGLATGDAAALGLTLTSRPGVYFLAAHAPAVILSYSEVLFDRSEAAARGFTTENAALLYQQAIQASLNQYGIKDITVIANYLSQSSVVYNAANFKKSIGDQKWIALFGQGLEAFAEWRRLDYPQLTPAATGVLNGLIPVRFIYPGTEQTLNGVSYTNAVKHQGTDILTTKLWFDVY